MELDVPDHCISICYNMLIRKKSFGNGEKEFADIYSHFLYNAFMDLFVDTYLFGMEKSEK